MNLTITEQEKQLLIDALCDMIEFYEKITPKYQPIQDIINNQRTLLHKLQDLK